MAYLLPWEGGSVAPRSETLGSCDRCVSVSPIAVVPGLGRKEKDDSDDEAEGPKVS